MSILPHATIYYFTPACVIHLCSTHFLKLSIKKTKGIATDDQNKIFTFCVSLLQNESTLENFENTICNVFYIFKRTKKDYLHLKAIEELRKDCINRKIKKNMS